MPLAVLKIKSMRLNGTKFHVHLCGQALITVSNHVASLDDPLATAALLPLGALLRPSALRWTLCATDRCFTSPAASAFFRAAKVLLYKP